MDETTANEIRENNEISVKHTLIECSSIIFRGNWFNVQFNMIPNCYLLTFWLETFIFCAFSWLPFFWYLVWFWFFFLLFWHFSFFVIHCTSKSLDIANRYYCLFNKFIESSLVCHINFFRIEFVSPFVLYHE